MPKRKLDDINECNDSHETNQEIPAKVRRDVDSCCGVNRAGREGRRVRFDDVTMYYFERSQGFSCVPSFGGTTLGMKKKHYSMRTVSLIEHEELVMRGRVSKNLTSLSNGNDVSNTDTETDVSEDDDEEEEEEEEEKEEISVDDDYFPQPLANRQRRRLLQSSGVRLDKTETSECSLIRVSRQICGCSCPLNCRPETCECAIGEIKCQVDRPSFPCGCSADSCGNPFGRVEFNALRVRAHYVQTMMRVRMQSRCIDGLVLSPSHIRFEDDGSTYCSPPPPPYTSALHHNGDSEKRPVFLPSLCSHQPLPRQSSSDAS